MNLNNEIYWHIKLANTPQDEWFIGNRFNWNGRVNKCWRDLFSFPFKFQNNGSQRSLLEVSANILRSNGNGLSNQEYINDLKNIQDLSIYYHYKQLSMVRELVLEDFRRRSCPYLPSRMNCVWFIAPDLNCANFWIQQLGAAKKGFQIFEVRLNGLGHFASNKHIALDILNIEEHEKLASYYWAPNQPFGFDSELIFNGQIEILKLVHI